MSEPSQPLLFSADHIVDTVREPLLVLDAGLRVVWASRSFCGTFRVSAGDTEGHLIYDLGNGQWNIPALRTLLEEVLPRSTSFNDFEVDHTFPAIGRRMMLLNARRMNGKPGHTALILLAIEDITERRIAESVLAAQQEWLRVTLGSVGDGVIATDLQGRVTFLNAVAQDLTGWAAEEAMGVPVVTVFPIVNEHTRQPVENPAARAVREGVVVDLADHTLLIHKGGGEKPIDDSAAPIRDSEGRVIGVVLVFRDMSGQRRLQREAASARRYAEGIVEAVREPLVVLTPDLWVKTANRSFYQTFRVSPERTEGRLIFDLGDRQWDIPALRELLEGVLTQDKSFDGFEVAHEFPSIGRKVMLLNARRLEWAGGDDMILLAIEDMTEQRRAEDERREMETRFTSLVKNIKDHAIFTLDPEGRITSWNVEAERILGYSEAEAHGRHFSVIFSPEDVAEGIPDSELRTALEEGRAEDERWHLRKNGERFWALGIVTPTQDASGKHNGFSKILRDMTDRKRAEEEVSFHSHLLDVVGQAVIVTGPDGRTLYLNRFAETLYGWTKEEAVGRSVVEMVVPQGGREQAAEIMTRLRAGESWSGEFVVRRKDGTTFPALVTDMPVFDGQGEVKAIIGVSADLSGHKRLEEELRQRAGQLAEADSRKDEFLAMLSHELRNPLAPIRTAVDRMRLKVPHGSELHPVIDVVDRQVGHLTQMVDDLLDVSRITRGKIILHKERTDLGTVMARALETTRPLIDARQHELTYTPPQEAVPLEGDVTRLVQALTNLLTNAAKYTERGGRIWLTGAQDGGEAVVRVRDSGLGIAPEMLPRIFDLFTQANRSLDRSQGGLGVGLTVAKRLVEMHGGSLTAHSAGEGQGSEFAIRLPLQKEEKGTEAAGVQGKAATPPGKAARRRILLVDDLVEVAEDMASLLREGFGHEVRTAHDGPAALEVARSYRPDLVLLDIGLPGMNGYEVARRLRQQPDLEGTVLVALTGYGQEEDRRKTQEAGFDHHLVKPVGIQALRPVLEALT